MSENVTSIISHLNGQQEQLQLDKAQPGKNIYTEEKADCKGVLQLGGWNCHDLLFNVFQDKKWVSKAD